jgi:enamine deaminase RidA (YjgF/YER057c/UK114 family)
MHKIIQPEGWKRAKGYADGVLAEGARLYVAGQIGWNKQQVFEHHDLGGQMEQALRNILEVVESAGGTATDIVRLTWYIIDKKDYLAKQKEIGEAYRRVMGKHFPAMTVVVVTGLIEDGALVEIEATAVISCRRSFGD